jgi:hypothetical protein
MRVVVLTGFEEEDVTQQQGKLGCGPAARDVTGDRVGVLLIPGSLATCHD